MVIPEYGKLVKINTPKINKKTLNIQLEGQKNKFFIKFFYQTIGLVY